MNRVLALLFATLLVTACAGESTTGADAEAAGDDASGQPLRVVVSTTILGDVVTSLVDGVVDVEVLLPTGADPHDFALSAGQAEAMRTADLLVVNGGNLEEGLIDAVDAAEEAGIDVFEATAFIDTIAFGAHDEDGDEHAEGDGDDHAHDEDGADPHFWHDPLRMSNMVDALAEELAQVDDTLDDSEWTARAEAIHEELEALDAEIRETLSVIPDERRILVTNHDALGYLADAYDFTIVGTVIPGGATLAEPSAADLEALIEVVTDTGAPAVFTDTIDNSRLAEVVAEEAGRNVIVADLYTDSLSDADGKASTYADLMRANAQTLADALG